MFVDIHSHHATPSNLYSIRSIDITESLALEQGLFYSVGLHPWHAEQLRTENYEKLKQVLISTQSVAVGECGLDKFSTCNYDTQKEAFEKQIVLSESYNKPLIIHCVGYFNELLAIKKHIHPSQEWIIHAFRGKPQLAKQLLDAGCSLSYGEHYHAESLQITPLDKLYIETDESKIPIEQIYKKIALDKGCGIDDLNAGSQFWHKHCRLL